MTPNYQSGEVITFYSFKGGTGRSMAVANVAAVLSRNGQTRVLMIDWDIEAPGLDRFFDRQLAPEASERIRLGRQPGLLDLFAEISQILAGPEAQVPQSDDESDQFFAGLHIDRFIVKMNERPLDLLPAGAFDVTYSSRVQTFDWASLYSRAPWLYSAFVGYLSRQYRYVLVDSRTGVSDVTGICTTLVPDKLVVVFTPNRQSLLGALDVVVRSVAYRKESADLRPLLVFPLPSRIEHAEDKLRVTWRRGNEAEAIPGYQPLFEALLAEVYDLPECKLESYFNDVQVQYIPRYAYGEDIAVLDEGASDRLSLARSYETFTARLTAPKGPWDETSLTEAPAPNLNGGELKQAAQLFHEALERYIRAGDLAGQASVLRRLGDLHFRFGHLDESAGNYIQARELFQKIGDKHGEATVLKSLGDASKKQKDVPASAAFYETALKLFEEKGALREMGEVWRAIGDLQQGDGDVVDAIQSYSEAYEASVRANDARGRGLARLAGAEVASLLGKHNEAARWSDEAAHVFHQISDAPRQLTALQQSFSAWMKQGDVNNANPRFRQAIGIQGGALVSKGWKGEALVEMAERLVRDTRYQEAVAMYKEAEAVYTDGPPGRLAAVLRGLGDAQVELFKPNDAKASYTRALEIYRSIADDQGHAAMLERLGTLAFFGGH
ncbi:hypothetical protein SBA6_70032 [Candidatus Sulfopaludibacter sp. SbA6]|nr:hypothetical protein SBA6_70032 [Candidatus Sulfopaludibacter sp. SbA6]